MWLLMQVMVNLHSAHMDPDDWQQPQQFRPERFLDQSGNVVDRDRIIYPSHSVNKLTFYVAISYILYVDGSVAEWLACWTQEVQKGPGSNRSRDAVG